VSSLGGSLFSWPARPWRRTPDIHLPHFCRTRGPRRRFRHSILVVVHHFGHACRRGARRNTVSPAADVLHQSAWSFTFVCAGPQNTHQGKYTVITRSAAKRQQRTSKLMFGVRPVPGPAAGQNGQGYIKHSGPFLVKKRTINRRDASGVSAGPGCAPPPIFARDYSRAAVPIATLPDPLICAPLARPRLQGPIWLRGKGTCKMRKNPAK